MTLKDEIGYYSNWLLYDHLNTGGLLFFKTIGGWGLEGWFGGQEHLLLLQRIVVQFPTTIQVTPVPRNPIPSSGQYFDPMANLLQTSKCVTIIQKFILQSTIITLTWLIHWSICKNSKEMCIVIDRNNFKSHKMLHCILHQSYKYHYLFI